MCLPATVAGPPMIVAMTSPVTVALVMATVVLALLCPTPANTAGSVAGLAVDGVIALFRASSKPVLIEATSDKAVANFVFAE